MTTTPPNFGPKSPPPEDTSPHEPWWRWRGTPAQIFGLAGALFIFSALWLAWALPINRALEPLPTPTLILVSADGEPFGRRGSYKEEPVEISQLPDYVPNAFIAIEDRRFRDHFGLDPRGIARAARNNVRDGGISEGGSTITQQLAKNAFLSQERTFRRKAQEALIALYLEGRLSKDDILSRYLSSVYFGDGVFGLRAAARAFFDKAPEDLTIGEAAMLAGVVKAPSRLAPTEDLQASRERAHIVLDAMVETGVITEREARRARNVRVREGRTKLPVGSYFADWVSPQAKRSFERAYGEVRVETTLDSRLQRRAEQIIRNRLAWDGRRSNVHQAALVAMRPDGSVVALVGGRDYKESQYDRATMARRQPGSAFKLFVYLTALREGATPDHRVLDAPIQIGDWSPSNHEQHYLGKPITLRKAFARSSNVAAVRVLKEVGVGSVIRTARDLGVTSDLPNDATVALGTGSVTLLELTAAYAAIAAGEAPVRPHGLKSWERDRKTKPLPKAQRDGMMELMGAVVSSGTGTAANPGVRAYGKTGTTQDYRDAVFIGFAGDLVVGVWVGNDDNDPMRKVTGGGLPARIWRDFVSYAVARERGRAPAPPPETTEEVPDEAGLNPSLLEGAGLGGAEPEAGSPPEDQTAPGGPIVPSPAPLPVPPPPGGGDVASLE